MTGTTRKLTGTLWVLALGIACLQSAAVENPYQALQHWGDLPQGRTWGSTSAVFVDQHDHIWVAERCGENSCVGKDDVDPILMFDRSGQLLRSFGAGLFVWPHSIFVDREDNVWVSDARGVKNKGHQVLKFSSRGKLLMTLGKAGIAGPGLDTFDGPTAVLVAPNGNIFVADGHGNGGNNRIVKFSAEGKFLKTWGKLGCAKGEFREPHALAMDSRGRLFVADRHNSRIQLFNQEGKYLETWTQFSQPSGLFIDRNDLLYAADSESNAAYYDHRGWPRGIRIGSALTGVVTAFIPDREKDPEHSYTSGAEGVAVDSLGDLYGAEVGPRQLRKYILQRRQ